MGCCPSLLAAPACCCWLHLLCNGPRARLTPSTASPTQACAAASVVEEPARLYAAAAETGTCSSLGRPSRLLTARITRGLHGACGSCAEAADESAMCRCLQYKLREGPWPLQVPGVWRALQAHNRSSMQCTSVASAACSSRRACMCRACRHQPPLSCMQAPTSHARSTRRAGMTILHGAPTQNRCRLQPHHRLHACVPCAAATLLARCARGRCLHAWRACMPAPLITAALRGSPPHPHPAYHVPRLDASRKSTDEMCGRGLMLCFANSPTEEYCCGAGSAVSASAPVTCTLWCSLSIYRLVVAHGVHATDLATARDWQIDRV